MTLLFGIVAVVGIGCFAGFLTELRKEEKQAAPRSFYIYIAQDAYPGFQKVAVRRCDPLTVIGGRQAALPAPTRIVRKAFPVLRTVPFPVKRQIRSPFQKDGLRHESA